MPLTRERPGLFRGRANGVVDWYVVSPSVADPAAEAGRWRSRVAKSNRTLTGRVVSATVGWVVFLAVFCGAVALVWFVAEQRWPGWPLYCVAISVLGLLAAVIAAVACYGLVDRSEFVVASTDTVMPVDSSVAEWANDGIPVADIWALNYALHTVEDAGPEGEWGVEDATWRPPSPLQDALQPVIDEHRVRYRAQLAEVAGRLGYPLDSADEPPAPR